MGQTLPVFVLPDLMKPFPLSWLLSHLPAMTNRQNKNPTRSSTNEEKSAFLGIPLRSVDKMSK
jgi:hypothetical protein